MSATNQLQREFIFNHKSTLREYVESMYELIDVMRNHGLINREQHSKLGALNNVYDRNDAIFKLLLDNWSADRYQLFLEALNDTEQKHVVNFIESRGDRQVEHGGCWPLSFELKTNAQLKLVLEAEYGLVDEMASRKCCTHEQIQRIKEAPPCQINSLILETMERRSVNDYNAFIDCLNETEQFHVAEMFINLRDTHAGSGKRFQQRPKQLATLDTDREAITGIAYLNNRICITHHDSNILQVYQIHVDPSAEHKISFSRIEDIAIKVELAPPTNSNADSQFSFIRSAEAYTTIEAERVMPIDITVCSMDSCIYVSDAWSGGCIWRINVHTDDVKVEKIIRDSSQRISLSGDGRVILSSGNLIKYHSGTGHTWQRDDIINLVNILNCRHAVQTRSGRLIASCQLRPNVQLQGLNKIDGSEPPQFAQAFGIQSVVEVEATSVDKRYATYVRGIYHCPASHLAVGPGEHIFVAESEHNRILLLGPELTLHRVLLTSEDGIESPERLCYVEKSEETGWLLVGMKTGRVSVFLFEVDG